MYRRFLERYGDNEPLAAAAQLHIGICYEKLGLREAQAAYRKVIENYPSQAESVKVARDRLAMLVKAQSVIDRGDKGLKVRQVLSGPDLLYDGWLGSVSPDGRHISIVDWETGDLAVRELSSGKKRRLTQRSSGEYALYSIWSPDSRKIAYDWWTGRRFAGIYTIDLNGPKARLLYQDDRMMFAQPVAWSPDGKQILAVVHVSKQQGEVVLIAVADGSVQAVRIPNSGRGKMVFSPDGRFIAYEFQQAEDAYKRDIGISSVRGDWQALLVEHPADDSLLGWSPDGQWILFSSDRTGAKVAWLQKVAEGKSQGAPELLGKDQGLGYPLGFTNDGSFYYSTSKEMQDVYTAALDPETGSSSPPKKMILAEEGNNL
jgi:Tol biopolymer transport system component